MAKKHDNVRKVLDKYEIFLKKYRLNPDLTRMANHSQYWEDKRLAYSDENNKNIDILLAYCLKQLPDPKKTRYTMARTDHDPVELQQVQDMLTSGHYSSDQLSEQVRKIPPVFRESVLTVGLLIVIMKHLRFTFDHEDVPSFNDFYELHSCLVLNNY